MFLLIFCTLFALSYAQTIEPSTECYCSVDYKPVCTTDGTYDNLCLMKCAQRHKLIYLVHEGVCQKRKEIKPPCFCKEDSVFIKPICEIRWGTGERTTFKNRCIRECVRKNEKNKDLGVTIIDGMCRNYRSFTA